MRYDKDVYFVTTSSAYNPETGDYDEAEPVRHHRKASVMDTTAAMLKLVYGTIRQGSLTIHLQEHYAEPFEYIEYDGILYAVDFSRKLRTKHTFVVSEVPHGRH